MLTLGALVQKQAQDDEKQDEAHGRLRETLNALQLRMTSMGLGPSVAGAQLGQGLEQINRAQGSQAAGVGGEGGVLARYEAMNSAAGAGAAANQSAALARATEVANAQHNLEDVLGNESTTAGNIYGTNVTGVNTGNANSITEKKNDEDFQTKLLGAGLSGYSQYKAGLGSGGAAGGSGATLSV